MQEVEIFCDGSGMTAATPCGFAAILRCGGKERELTGALVSGTNNTAEIMAAVLGLEALKKPCVVSVTSDSEYLVHGIMHGRAKRWQSRGWKKRVVRDGGKIEEIPAPNAEYWKRLLTALKPHKATFHWVRGHNGHPENSRCDKLAKAARENYLDYIL